MAAPPPAAIRPFDTKTDLKLVRYLVGASVMEPYVLFRSLSCPICGRQSVSCSRRGRRKVFASSTLPSCRPRSLQRSL